VLGPDCGQSAETAGGLDVSDQTNNNHGGSLDDRNGLNDFLVVDLGTRLVGCAEDVRHTGLVAHEGGEVARLGGVILGELADAATVVGATLAGEEPEGTVTGGFELTV